NMEKLRGLVEFIHWNPNGWKFGHCSVPPIGKHVSLLNLSNNTGVVCHFESLFESFQKLYRRRAHLHHYLSVDNMIQEEFDICINSIQSLIKN
ncbi:hypothetical protein, partial [Salmonella sp. s54836]|uniref:hypothetical protein n=1 Tax=Salmonella sp. s54836 TaxID=3159673 RepID=UPI00398193C7